MKAEQLPTHRKPGEHQRRMRVRRRGMRNQRTSHKVSRRGNVVPGFIPKIRKAEQREMRGDKDESEDDEQIKSGKALCGQPGEG